MGLSPPLRAAPSRNLAALFRKRCVRARLGGSALGKKRACSMLTRVFVHARRSDRLQTERFWYAHGQSTMFVDLKASYDRSVTPSPPPPAYSADAAWRARHAGFFGASDGASGAASPPVNAGAAGAGAGASSSSSSGGSAEEPADGSVLSNVAAGGAFDGADAAAQWKNAWTLHGPDVDRGIEVRSTGCGPIAEILAGFGVVNYFIDMMIMRVRHYDRFRQMAWTVSVIMRKHVHQSTSLNPFSRYQTHALLFCSALTFCASFRTACLRHWRSTRRSVAPTLRHPEHSHSSNVRLCRQLLLPFYSPRVTRKLSQQLKMLTRHFRLNHSTTCRPWATMPSHRAIA